MELYNDEDDIKYSFAHTMTNFQDDDKENRAMDPQNEFCEDDQPGEESRITEGNHEENTIAIAPLSTPLISVTKILFTATKIGLPAPTEKVLNIRGTEVFQALVCGELTFRVLRQHNRTHPKTLGVMDQTPFNASLRYIQKLLDTAETPSWITRHILQLLNDCKDDTTALQREDIIGFLILLRHVIWDIWGQIHVHDPYCHPRVDDTVRDMLTSAIHATSKELAGFLETWRVRSWKTHLERIAREAGFLPIPHTNQQFKVNHGSKAINTEEVENPQSKMIMMEPGRRSPRLKSPTTKHPCTPTW
eukprot:gb/GECG01005256.1/.p1 GENE.gb/GECG01005256.1/~~gb/GECG01005256.1/.p1  ORF type:complete len:304 (+),score=34.64 gb/GECG01005256.1/:1-912(+)